jgi:hypothetical protein
MHIDEVATFKLDFISNPRPSGYGAPDCEIYLPNVVAAYLVEFEQDPQHLVRDCQRSRDLLPVFLDAGWEFCRRGVLRPAEVNGSLLATPAGFEPATFSYLPCRYFRSSPLSACWVRLRLFRYSAIAAKISFLTFSIVRSSRCRMPTISLTFLGC